MLLFHCIALSLLCNRLCLCLCLAIVHSIPFSFFLSINCGRKVFLSSHPHSNSTPIVVRALHLLPISAFPLFTYLYRILSTQKKVLHTSYLTKFLCEGLCMPLKGFPDTANFSFAYLNLKYSLNCASKSRRSMLEDNPNLSPAVNSCFGKKMAPESNPLENVTAMAEERVEAVGGLKPPRIGKPPRHCASSIQLASAAELDLDIGIVSVKSTPNEAAAFVPVFRSGSCSEIGPKPFMEDEHICIDNLLDHLGAAAEFTSPGAFYGVFDGHGGTDAALYIRENILRFIVEDTHFPICARKAIESAFLRADCAFADTTSLDSSSGTTALTVLLSGRKMLIANAGDCRAVLGKRGKAIELSKDHKPDSLTERHRIETLGGIVYDGYLNGQLSVARALGDWHMKGPKGSSCPLIADPELQEMVLSEEDEFLILGCDGLWDVMSSQCAVTIARRELMLHNDPERCSRELVREALKRDTRDNLTVVVICFSSDPPPRLEVPRYKFKRSISAEGLNLLQEVLDSPDTTTATSTLWCGGS